MYISISSYKDLTHLGRLTHFSPVPHFYSSFFQSFRTLRTRQKQNQLLRFYCRVKPGALFPVQGRL